MCRNAFGQIHGDNGLDHNGVFGHLPVLHTLGADIVQQQQANLVAAEQPVVPFQSPHGNAHPVAVRVCGQEQIRIGLFRILHAQGHGLPNFGIGIGAGGKMAIGLFLLRHHCNIGIAHFFQRAGHGLQPGTVQRAIHNGNISVDLFAEQHRLALHFLHKGRINIIRDIPDRSVCNIRFKGTVLNIRKDVQLFDLCQDLRCGLGRDLATIRAVDLVAVILAGVVGGRDHNARRRFQVSYREGNRGNRHQRGPDVHLHSVCRKYTGSDPGKQVALDAAVVANGHGRV